MDRVYEFQVYVAVDAAEEGKVGRERRDVGIVPVRDIYGDGVLRSEVQIRGDVEAEPGVAAYMIAGCLSVHVERRFLVRSLEINDGPAAFEFFGDCQILPVPGAATIHSRFIILGIFCIPCMRDVDYRPTGVV